MNASDNVEDQKLYRKLLEWARHSFEEAFFQQTWFNEINIKGGLTYLELEGVCATLNPQEILGL